MTGRTLAEAKRIILREISTADTNALHALYSDPLVTEHLSFEPRTRAQSEQIVTRAVTTASELPRNEYGMAVATRDSGVMIGFARLALDPHQQQAATIGFALAPDAWGRGLGIETVWVLGELAFVHLGLHRLWAARAPLNDRSGRTLEHAGFTAEGLIREHVFVRGAWRDSRVYGQLHSEHPDAPPSSTVQGPS